ncbi:MAG: hypothetical protein HYU42_08175 [Candidatus Rokubacteria bacterium]|nr:hypothetical protein [Candidatus Rokubacteria bacterium]
MKGLLAMGRKWWVLAALASLVLACPAAGWAQNTFPGSGNVGIGTTSPGQPLTIADTTPAIRLDHAGTSSGAFDIQVSDNGSSPVLDVLDAGSADVLLRILRSSGRVGIGTTSPGRKLTVAGSAPALRLDHVGTRSGAFDIEVSDNGASPVLDVVNAGSGDVLLRVVRASGNVGIGTETPTSARLQVDSSANTPTFAAIASKDSGYAGTVIRGVAARGGDSEYYLMSLENGGGAGSLFVVRGDGRVGIGTTAPSAKLHVAGDAQVDGNIAAKYQDIAEWVRTGERLPGGAVVAIDETQPNRVVLASRPYDTRVAGVVSERPGVLLGEAAEDKAKVAHSGRVKVKVDARYGAVAIGDLLVTSPTAGHAMRSAPVDLGGMQVHRPGTLLGKALEPLPEGQGEILVLLMLQ